MPSATGKGARVLQHRVRFTFQWLFRQDSFEGPYWETNASL